MALDVSTFKLSFPEFKSTADEMVEAYLVRAATHCDAEAYLTKYEDAVLYRCAHMLALSPQGASAKLVNKDGSTTYGMHFDDIRREVAAGWRVCD
jgi:Protein of unknown function (DUF4054)